MNVTYVNADNSAGDSGAFAGKGQDVLVKKIIFGLPTDGGITILHNSDSVGGHASGMGSIPVGNAAIKITQPTAAAGEDHLREIDFTGGDANGGLPLDGGSIHTDEAQVSIIWEIAGAP